MNRRPPLDRKWRSNINLTAVDHFQLRAGHPRVASNVPYAWTGSVPPPYVQLKVSSACNACAARRSTTKDTIFFILPPGEATLDLYAGGSLPCPFEKPSERIDRNRAEGKCVKREMRIRVLLLVDRYASESPNEYFVKSETCAG